MSQTICSCIDVNPRSWGAIGPETVVISAKIGQLFARRIDCDSGWAAILKLSCERLFGRFLERSRNMIQIIIARNMEAHARKA